MFCLHLIDYRGQIQMARVQQTLFRGIILFAPDNTLNHREKSVSTAHRFIITLYYVQGGSPRVTYDGHIIR